MPARPAPGNRTRVDIVGAGIGGLATAYYLSKSASDLRIRVWEKEPSPGGLAGVFTGPGFTVEKFYHHIYRSDGALQALLGELGLRDRLEWKPALTGAYHLRKSFRLSTPLDLLRYRPLPLRDRLRLARMVLAARREREWDRLDDESAREYVARRAGENLYRRFWEPLLVGKFGPHAERISAAWLCSKLADRGGSRNRLGREILGYLNGGLGLLFEALVRRLEGAGHRVHLGTEIRALRGGPSRVERLETADGRHETDLVVGCAQLPDLAELLAPDYSTYARELAKIDFLANVCLVMTLRNPLSKFYWTNVTDPQAPFVGIVEQSNWVAPSTLHGQHVAYISSYVPREDPRMKMEPGELLDFYLPWLRKMFPAFAREEVVALDLWKAPYAQPIVKVGYRKLVPPVQSPLENFFVCTMAQIYPHDRQISNGIEMARRTAERIRDKLRAEAP